MENQQDLARFAMGGRRWAIKELIKLGDKLLQKLMNNSLFDACNLIKFIGPRLYSSNFANGRA
jgi:hypothetical protein